MSASVQAASPPGRQPDRFARVLRWGFGAAMVLVVAAAAASVVEVQRARREVSLLARTADRSTFLVGEIGRHVSRMRALALDQLVQPDRDDVVEDEELFGVTNALDEALRELEPLLQPNEIEPWRAAMPLFRRFQEEVITAVTSIRAGAPDAARRGLVERVRPLALETQDLLDELGRLNEEEGRVLLVDADRRLARIPALEALIGVTVLLGMLAIWWTVRRTLARQRRALERHLARIEASNRDLDAFAGRIAHDLRNALAPLGAGGTVLRRAAGRPDLVARIAETLDAAVRRCGLLLDGLLAFSRAADRVDAAEPASVRRTLSGVLEELAPLATRVGAEVDVALEDVDVSCPPALLHIVGANVIGNALKFLDGSPVRRVAVSARRAGEWCEIAVVDTGPGIPAEARGRIFEPFYRAPGGAASGTGIGLATVVRIVEASGGTVTVDSEVGKGSAFRVRLPMRTRPPARSVPPVPHAPYDPPRG